MTAVSENHSTRVPVRLSSKQVRLLPIRTACAVGLCDSVAEWVTAIATRPRTASIAFGALWIIAWALAIVYADTIQEHARRRVLLLPLAAATGFLPALLDGGYPGTLGTQATWIVAVAAATVRWPTTVATGLAAATTKAVVVTFTGTAVVSAGVVLTAVTLPLLLVPLVIALRFAAEQALRILLPAAVTPRTARLTPAEAAVVAMLASGLAPKEIASTRGTTLATVRTQIKRAKRATGALTLEELVATVGRQP